MRMPDLVKTMKILAGSALTIIGIAWVPSAIRSGNASGLFWSTIGFFAGVLILGWAAKE
jgi:hypothetical protein